MGSEDRVEQSLGRPCRWLNGRSKPTCELTSSKADNICSQCSAMAQAVRDLITGDLMMTVPLITRNPVDLHEAGKIRGGLQNIISDLMKGASRPRHT